MDSKLKEIEKRRAERRDAQATAKAARELLDLEAIDALEAKSGEVLHTMSANAFKVGHPVKIAFRCPEGEVYRRYQDQISRAEKNPTGKREAIELFARSCIAYPDPKGDGFEAFLEAFPGVLVSVAIEAAKVAELRAEEEGKG